jgi:regulatory protein
VRKFPSGARTPQAERGRRPMDAALGYLSARARTVREVERYLDGQNYGESEVQQTVERLQELGYLNDAEFAGEFVRTRLNTKPVSRYKLQEQLYSHELPRDIVEQALEAVDDDVEKQNAVLVARKYAEQMRTLSREERDRRLMQRMVGRGFSYDVSRLALETLDLEGEDGGQHA